MTDPDTRMPDTKIPDSSGDSSTSKNLPKSNIPEDLPSRYANQPTGIIVLGMAGSGKTTFVQRLTADIAMRTEKSPYVMNLDPAVSEVPYPTNIDIRETVEYKQVMKDYGLGPNGAIMTSLNLFATKFDQVMKILESKKDKHEYVVIDTPGQIEVFTWSASGQIITEAISSIMPTVVVYVMDSSRCTNATTFMSNMLYACSIMFKTKLPFFIVLNKTDIVDASYCLEWMSDYESYDEALKEDETFSSNLSRSLSLLLDEFYEDLKAVPFSSLYGTGLDELYEAIGEKREEFFTEFLPELEKVRKNIEKRREKEGGEGFKKSQIKTDNEMPSDIVYNGMHEKDEIQVNNNVADKNFEQKREERLEDGFKKYLDLNSGAHTSSSKSTPK